MTEIQSSEYEYVAISGPSFHVCFVEPYIWALVVNKTDSDLSTPALVLAGPRDICRCAAPLVIQVRR